MAWLDAACARINDTLEWGWCAPCAKYHQARRWPVDGIINSGLSTLSHTCTIAQAKMFSNLSYEGEYTILLKDKH